MKTRLLAILSTVSMVASLLVVAPLPVAAQTPPDPVAILEDAISSAAVGEVIQIDPGVYQLTAPLTINVNNVTIEGLDSKAAGVELRAANNERVFNVTASGVKIRNLAIIGGRQNNDKGGGIHVAAGATLDLIDVEVLNNFAVEGAGLYNAGTVTISGSLFEGNDARRKGGGIENDGLLTVINSTLTNNEGQGGGGLSTAGTASLSFVTVFSNRSTNKIGAGTLRNGGTLAVKNSIVANNVGSDGDFHDCSGTPNFQNVIVTSDQGCNPEGTYEVFGPADVVEPLPPADNGGPTRTLALLDNSPAIDYTADCTDLSGNPVAVDQRSVGRDDGLCDLGAVEYFIEPLTFIISMTTSVPEIEVGAVIVPVENIGAAIQATAGEGTSTASTPLSSIPLSSIPLSSIPLSSIPLSSIPLSSIPLSSIPLSSIPLSSIPLSSIPLSSIPLSSIDAVLDCGTACPEDVGLEYLLTGTPLQDTPLQALNFTDLVSVPLSSIPLSSIPLSSIPLSSIPLSSIPLSSIGNAINCGAIAGGCEDPNTLEDAFDSGAVISGGTVGDVLAFDDVSFGATPLSSIPLSSIAMGTTPLSSIPLSSILVGADPAVILAEWCSVLNLADGSPGCDLVEAPGTSLMTLALGGIPLSSIPLSSIPLSSIPLSSIPLSSIPLSSIYWTSTPLSSIPLSSIPLSSIPLSSIPLSSIPLSSIGDVVDCGLVNCTTGTLGEAAANDAFLVDTLGELGPYLEAATIGELGGLDGLDEFSLGDLLFGLLAPAEIPWEDIDLQAARLPDAADPRQPAFTYDIELVVGGDLSADIDVSLLPPEGFYFARDLVPNPKNYETDPDYPTTLDGVQVADPVEDLATGALSLTLEGVSPGTHTLSIAMRAGIVLGDHEASVTGQATTSQEGPLAAGPATKSILVIEAGENGGGSGIVPTLIDGELNLSHISRSDDLDFYEFTVGANLAGSSARILLSNLPADYDLVLYGPPVSAPLRGTPEPGFGIVEDFVFDLSPNDEVLDTDTLQDVPHDPTAIPNHDGEVLNSISAKRGTNDEEIDTGTLREGHYVVQVSSYNGVFNPVPFGLRIRLSETAQRVCSAPEITFGTRGQLPTIIPDGLNTLFLYNHARLTNEYTATESNLVLDELARITASDWSNEWTALGVVGLVVPVDGDGDVWTALIGDAQTPGLVSDQCNPEASNDVVRAIGDLIDSYPEVENIVIIGDDAQIPMARILDGTAISNEREHGLTFTGNNELVGALLGGYYLSDVPYGTTSGISVNDHEFFVPERAVGRLVEHPADIARALANFVNFEGLLDPSTAAVATGYDFLSDGADLIKSELVDEGFVFGTGDFLNNETWTRQNLIDLLDPTSGGPMVASINAHFDQSRALPALGNSSGTESDLFTIADLASTFDEAILFSMGCHAGLSVSDVQVGSPSADWAESLGGIWGANTGYGYGDTQLIALSEQITANFASRLGTFPVGKAWQLALQEYAGDLFTLTPYDEKVLQEFTLYGLPMYVTGPAAESVPVLPPAAGTGPVTFNDPFTLLQTTSISIDLQLDGNSGPGSLHKVVSPDGDHYEVDGETLQVRSRPVQPLTGVDVTIPNGSGGLESVAAGALITGLTGLQMQPFDPLVFTPVIDVSDASDGSTSGLVDVHRPEAADATFPTGIQRVSTSEDDTGQQRQRLLVVPGRYVAEGPGGVPTQELFTDIDGLVYYRNPVSADFTAPHISESVGRYGDDVVHFEVDVQGGDVERVYVLFRPDSAVGPTTWLGVDLNPAGGDTWLGGRPIFPFLEGLGNFEFFVQAVDSNGNVSMSDAKGENFLTSLPLESDVVTITINGGTPPTATGWYLAASATAASTGGNITSYSLDFGDPVGWDGTTPLPISGDGGHLLQVFDSAGNQGIVFVAVDGSGPLAFGSYAPAPGPSGWNGEQVTVTLEAIDQFGSGVDKILYSTGGSTPSLEYTGPFSFAAEGISTIRYLAIDAVGNQGAEGTPLNVKIDMTAPDVTATVPPSDSGWYNQPVQVTLAASDTASGVEMVEYRLNPGDQWAEYSAPFEVTAEGETTVYFRATDAVGNTGVGELDFDTIAVQVDLTAPAVSISVPGDGSLYSTGEIVYAAYECSDTGSGIESCVGTVSSGDPIDTSAVGVYSFEVTAMDVAGNTTTAAVTYTVGYNVCLQYDPDKGQSSTGAVPIKLQLCDEDGNNVSAATIDLRAEEIRDESNGNTLFPGPNDTGNSNEDFFFRYRSKGYIYNLNTTEVTDSSGNFVPLGPGVFTLFFSASTTGPDVLYEARFTLKE